MTTAPGLPADLSAALSSIAADDVLVALDFDGVLAPIVEHPSEAAMPPATRRALTQLVAARPARVALVSGRALADLTAVADPPEGTLLVGSHGAETAGSASPRDALDDRARTLLATLAAEVQAVVDAHPGTAREDKPAGVVLHTRRADRGVAAAAARQVLAGPGRREGVRVTEGKEVVELSVADADKGRALVGLRAATGARRVLYAGDDVTDEHAFAALDDDAGDITIKVGDGPTRARWRVPGPGSLPRVLVALLPSEAQ